MEWNGEEASVVAPPLPIENTAAMCALFVLDANDEWGTTNTGRGTIEDIDSEDGII